MHLTYSLNVHPGESLSEVRAAIGRHATRVKAAVSPDRPFGLGLRLAAAAARELTAPGATAAFGAELASRGMFAFTINGFPYGAFHGVRVKERVYRPDWRDDARLAYTLSLAESLAELLPEGDDGSISTVPCGYAADMRSRDDASAAARNLADLAAGLAAIEERTGREIHIGMEPEPGCLLETTGDVLDFFEQVLTVDGAARLCEAHGRSRQCALDLLRRHIGICLDTCHVAVAFEEPAEALATLTRAGIRISKVQLSAAPVVPAGRFAPSALAPFANPVYLSQTRIRRTDGVVDHFADLPEALARATETQRRGEWRVHCHVPLYTESSDTLGTTAGWLSPGFFDLLGKCGVMHWEIETYTFDVLPESLRGADVADSIAREFRWVEDRSRLNESVFDSRSGVAVKGSSAATGSASSGPNACRLFPADKLSSDHAGDSA